MSTDYRPELLEKHPFMGDGNAYLCSTCAKPRALHQLTDFVPSPSQPVHDYASVRSGWNPQMMIRRGKLTDRQISKYASAGYYSQELKDARKALAAKRQGNFVKTADSLIYSPR